MWAPILVQSSLKPGSKLKTELVIGLNENLIVEYDIVENKDNQLLLKPLTNNSNPLPDDPAFYKKVSYRILYKLGIKIRVNKE